MAIGHSTDISGGRMTQSGRVEPLAAVTAVFWAIDSSRPKTVMGT